MLRIKDVLKEQGKTQIELSKALNVTPVGLNKIINGNPTVETLQKIADVLEVDVRDLFNATKGKEPKEEIQSIINRLENLKDTI